MNTVELPKWTRVVFPSFSPLQSTTGNPTIHSLSPVDFFSHHPRRCGIGLLSTSNDLPLCTSSHGLPRTPFLPRGPNVRYALSEQLVLSVAYTAGFYLLIFELDVHVSVKATGASVFLQDLRIVSVRAQSADMTRERREVGIATNRRWLERMAGRAGL